MQRFDASNRQLDRILQEYCKPGAQDRSQIAPRSHTHTHTHSLSLSQPSSTLPAAASRDRELAMLQAGRWMHRTRRESSRPCRPLWRRRPETWQALRSRHSCRTCSRLSSALLPALCSEPELSVLPLHLRPCTRTDVSSLNDRRRARSPQLAVLVLTPSVSTAELTRTSCEQEPG